MSEGVEIGEPHADDGERILEIARHVHLFEDTDVQVIAELWQEFIHKGSEKSGYHFLVARRDGQAIGFACYGPRPLTIGTYDLYWIAVEERYQGHGIGRHLLQEAERRVQAEGGRLIVVETEGCPEYEPTRYFYTLAGYTLEARIHDFYRPGDDLIVFTKRLQPAAANSR